MPMLPLTLKEFSNSLINASDSLFHYLIDDQKDEFDYTALKYDDDLFDQIAGRLVELQSALMLTKYLDTILHSPKADCNVKIVDYALSKILFDNNDISIGHYSELAHLLERHYLLEELALSKINQASRKSWNRYMDIRNLPIIDATVEFKNRSLNIRDICIEIFFQLLPFLNKLEFKDGFIVLNKKDRYRLFPFFYLRRSGKDKDRLLIFKKSSGENLETLYYEYDRYQSEIANEKIAIKDSRFGEINNLKSIQNIAASLSFSPQTIPNKATTFEFSIGLSHVEKFEKAADILTKCLAADGLFHIIKSSPFSGLVAEEYRKFNLEDENNVNISKQAILYFFYNDSPLRPLFIALSRTDKIEGHNIVNFAKNIDDYIALKDSSYSRKYILDKALQKGKEYFLNLPDSLAVQIQRVQARYLIFQIGIELFKAMGISVEKRRTQFPLIYFKTKIDNIYDYDDSQDSNGKSLAPSSKISDCRGLIISCAAIMEKLFKIILCFQKAIALTDKDLSEDDIRQEVEKFYESKIKKYKSDRDKSLESLFWSLYKFLSKPKVQQAYETLTGRPSLPLNEIKKIFADPIDPAIEKVNLSALRAANINFFKLRNLVPHDSKKEYDFDLRTWQFLSNIFYKKCRLFIDLIRNADDYRYNTWSSYYPYGVIMDKQETRFDGLIVRNYSLNHEFDYRLEKHTIKIITNSPVEEKIPYYVLPHSERIVNDIWIRPFILRASIIDDLFS